MEYNSVLRHVSTERLFCAENGELIDWLGFHGTATQTGHTAPMYDGKKQLGLTLISKYLSEWLLTNCNVLLCYILLYIFCFSAIVWLKGSPSTQWDYYGQKIIWNLRQGIRIKRDVEFHHSHPGSFTCPEYSSDTRNRHFTSPSDGRVTSFKSGVYRSIDTFQSF